MRLRCAAVDGLRCDSMAPATETKTCPQCNAAVRESTRRCRHCRHEFQGPAFAGLGGIAGWVLLGALCLGYVWQATH